ncbi:putative regulatory protein [Streptomyces albus]|uniref:Putative regulatory protein n=1 Tax=Streptomyces albus (strain ATCC 21838 / DSM 41398 / FERM P-419 / JCM 4703 / NBRC 107858) TaxID=1081613 RepID=A0A0B5F932_STRA4|nr:putative regulatory protein [Streptomyces albus]AOU81638.1 putative regulatory protein [Streptomyces albus]AYN37330.1 ATP-binding protein [Streptomyces albus]
MTVTATSRPTGHPGYSETLQREPESAATARRLVRVACLAWGLEKAAEDGALVVSELVANAVRHARRESVRVVVERTAVRTVRVAVADFSRARPVPCAPEDAQEGGRGLLLVAALSADWGTDERSWGKVVWAVLEDRG